MTEKKPYQVCTNCVMDTSDPRIVFDENGICDHCIDFQTNVQPRWNTGEQGQRRLEVIVQSIKRAGKGKDFDCLLGISGGMDSSYMLHVMVTKFGLRPLVFHIDGGWNTELSVHNINVLIDKLNLDLYTEVIDWEEMRDFQLAWFKSGVPHIDIPQDHAFIATLYNFADKYRIKYILNGGNISTEVVRHPIEYCYFGTDMIHIRDIIQRYCTKPMKTYPFSSIYRHKIYLRYVQRIKVIKPLNYLPYTKAAALKLLEAEYGWKPYPQKHFESRFTQFFEGYWLPTRFGYDVRRSQFSSLILTGQMTREAALQELEKPSYDPETIGHDFDYIATKLGISGDELRSYLTMPKKFYWDYRNQKSMLGIATRIVTALGLDRSGIR
ncbi:MAG TPA: N-acetyl sugar amidotransferase [Anaerolineae bacterium]|nr:N-acetyl sugar amidotransferase [Anaerolineae bacterium]